MQARNTVTCVSFTVHSITAVLTLALFRNVIVAIPSQVALHKQLCLPSSVTLDVLGMVRLFVRHPRFID